MRAFPVIIVVLCTLPTATAVPWLQAGYDAARTGATPDAGPRADDVAFEVLLAGSRADWAPPIILGDKVYLLTTDYGYEGLSSTAVWVIDLASGTSDALIPLDGPRTGIASDGQRLLVAGPLGIEAYALNGTFLWAVPHGDPATTGTAETRCAHLAVLADVVLAACTHYGQGHNQELSGQAMDLRDRVTTLVSIDLVSGVEQWRATLVPVEDASSASAIAPVQDEVSGLSVVGDLAIVRNTAGKDGGFTVSYRAFRVTDGVLQWVISERMLVEPRQGDPRYVSPTGIYYQEASDATGSPGEVLVKWGETLSSRKAEDGVERWRRVLAAQGDEAALLPHAFLALTGEALYAVTSNMLHRLELPTYTVAWSFSLPPGEVWRAPSPVVANGLLYGRALDGLPITEGRSPVIYAIDVEKGTVAWKREIQFDVGTVTRHPFTLFGVGEGVFVVAGLDGRVTVIGETAASLGPAFTVTNRYPAVGETVTIDMTATNAGAHGPPSHYRVEWGDGTVSDWQARPVLTHEYGAKGDRTARLQVRNDAGQTASRFVTFHVGTPAPVPPGLVETAFARDNQDLTFGLLGLALALGGGAIAVTNRQRRHSRLQRELAAIDAAAEAATDPTRLRAAMEDRRARCHGLLIDRAIDEAQYAVLERHIEAKLRAQRVDRLRELFDFLPTAMTRALEEMLEDGQITAVERRGIQAMVHENEVLTKAQKRKVTALVDAWFAQDEAEGS